MEMRCSMRKSSAVGTIKWILRILLVLFAVLPIYGGLIVALTPYENIMEPLLYPKYFCLHNLVEVWTETGLGRMIVNSVLYASLTTLCVVLVGVPAAYAFARYRFRGRRFLLFGFLSAQMFSPILILPTLYLLFSRLHLLNTFHGVVFAMTGFELALAIWLQLGFISTIPREVEESAMLDGASIGTILSRIVAPIAAPGIAASAMFTFTGTYNSFIVPLFLLTKSRMYPMTLGLYSMVTELQVKWHLVASASIIGLVPAVVFFLLAQRYIIEGAAAGAVKM